MAYHAPLAGAVFVAEILLGLLAVVQLGLVVVAALMTYGITVALTGHAVLFPVAPGPLPNAWQLRLMAATTHTPVMAALMVFEMTGRHDLLAVLLPACVVAALVSRRLHPTSVYGLGSASQALPR